jgi:hypothetical protein
MEEAGMFRQDGCGQYRFAERGRDGGREREVREGRREGEQAGRTHHFAEVGSE